MESPSTEPQRTRSKLLPYRRIQSYSPVHIPRLHAPAVLPCPGCESMFASQGKAQKCVAPPPAKSHAAAGMRMSGRAALPRGGRASNNQSTNPNEPSAVDWPRNTSLNFLHSACVVWPSTPRTMVLMQLANTQCGGSVPSNAWRGQAAGRAAFSRPRVRRCPLPITTTQQRLETRTQQHYRTATTPGTHHPGPEPQRQRLTRGYHRWILRILKTRRSGRRSGASRPSKRPAPRPNSPRTSALPKPPPASTSATPQPPPASATPKPPSTSTTPKPPLQSLQCPAARPRPANATLVVGLGPSPLPRTSPCAYHILPATPGSTSDSSDGPDSDEDAPTNYEIPPSAPPSDRAPLPPKMTPARADMLSLLGSDMIADAEKGSAAVLLCVGDAASARGCAGTRSPPSLAMLASCTSCAYCSSGTSGCKG
ncbi:hypothetical protein DFH27DRAFT_310210 [Peziza echinospora]|nr:hypothetical protein DFH27DRAFT_310210 [Peziza echinospora]